MNTFFSFLFLLSCVSLIVGLISPKTIGKMVRRNVTRKMIALVSVGVLFLSLMGIDPKTTTEQKDAQKETVSVPVAPQIEQVQETVEKVDLTNTLSEKASTPKESYSVSKVVDGDTIDVVIDGKTERLRLIGMDTPETVDPRKPVQCFGKEASAKMAMLVSGKSVTLEADPSQGERDKYGRLLRYVFLENGENVNLTMIAEGYAHEYTYNLPYKYQNEFKAAEQAAREAKKGLWATTACNGDTAKAAANPVTASPTITPQGSTTPTTTTAPTNSNTPTSVAPLTNGPPVKMSSTKICHAAGTTYYNKTTNFTPYNTIEECLAAGGRLPKG